MNKKMNSRSFAVRGGNRLIAVLAGLGMAVSSVAWAVEDAVRKPNIILILADDLGWSDLGCYGNTFHETPHIDRLARQGMLFTDAYAAAPLCSPTRASLQTGKYPARLGLTHIVEHRGASTEKWREPDMVPRLSLDEVTPFEALKPAGYLNASIGKWHLAASQAEVESDPLRQGADSSMADWGQPPDYFFPYRRTLSDGRVFELRRPPQNGVEGDYLSERMSDAAVAFIRQNQEGPFYLFLSEYLPHTSTGDRLQARADKIAKYQAKAGLDTPNIKTTYAAMVEHLDDSVGRVMNCLDELGIADHTLVIFVSDNGGYGRKTSNLPLRGAKRDLYEGGIRVPMIVRWPGQVEPGSVSHQPVITPDLYSTILDVAGVRIPPDRVVDGETLLPLLTDGAELQRQAIYWHYPHFTPTAGSAVRLGNYKLLELIDDQGVRLELYDLANDPGEQHNLVAAMPERVREMKVLLDRWRTDVGARMPTVVSKP